MSTSTTASLTLPGAAAPPLLASRKHTLGLLGIVAVLVLLGMLRAQHRGQAGAPSSLKATLVIYGVAIGLQLLWVWFVQGGMKDKGRSVREFFSRDWTGPSSLGKDLLYGIPAIGVLVAAMVGLHAMLGSYRPDTAFLIPHGILLSVLWVGVSLAAGIGEEIVFRGYLQGQLTAILGRPWLAIVLQALLFGVAHGYQGWKPILSASAGALILGGLAWWRGNIRAGIIAHTGLDLLGGLLP